MARLSSMIVDDYIHVQKLLFLACQLLEQVDFLPEDSELSQRFKDDQEVRKFAKEEENDG